MHIYTNVALQYYFYLTMYRNIIQQGDPPTRAVIFSMILSNDIAARKSPLLINGRGQKVGVVTKFFAHNC